MNIKDLIIRRAQFQDLSSIVQLLFNDELGSKREFGGSPLRQSYMDAFWRISDDPNNLLVVVELHQKIVGTFQLTYLTHLNYGGSRVAQIETVRVAAHLRGQKIGEEMMKWAIAQAKKQGCHRLQLTTDKKRPEALRFYQRQGFMATHEGMKLLLE